MKKQKTFTIDEKILNEFIKNSKEKSINKSLFVKNSIKKFIKEHNDNK